MASSAVVLDRAGMGGLRVTSTPSRPARVDIGAAPQKFPEGSIGDVIERLRLAHPGFKVSHVQENHGVSIGDVLSTRRSLGFADADSAWVDGRRSFQKWLIANYTQVMDSRVTITDNQSPPLVAPTPHGLFVQRSVQARLEQLKHIGAIIYFESAGLTEDAASFRAYLAQERWTDEGRGVLLDLTYELEGELQTTILLDVLRDTGDASRG